MKDGTWYYKFLVVFLLMFSTFFLFNKKISPIMDSSIKDIIINVVKPFNIIKAKKETELVIKEEVNNYEVENLKEEIEDLKETMNIEKTYTSYKPIYAKTIIRNKMYWFNTITIDKGRKQKVREESAVVTNNGLIGKVIRTNKTTSTVKLITNSDRNNKMSVMVKKENETIIGLIEEYEYPYLKVYIESNNVDKDDIIVTSGLGNLPKNIYVGTVEKKEKDKYSLNTILYVKTRQDMNDINYVAVLPIT